MKKIAFLFLLLSGLYVQDVQATHLMGGEITLNQVSGFDYEITLTAYRDTLGVPMRLTGVFYVLDTSGTQVMSFRIPYDTTSGGLQATIPYGIEIYVFKDTITLPGEGTFFIGYRDCCRNGAILNTTNPLGESMFLHTTLTVDTSIGNSTPYFLAPPTTYLQALTTWQYNPLPTDPDGDSLAWSIDTPLTASPILTGSYVTGYISPADTLNGPFSIDATTGQISWTAKNTGNYVASILVEEYRAGVKIGEIRRDMQFVVTPPTGASPKFTNMGSIPKNLKGYPQLNVGVGHSNNTWIKVNHPTPGTNLSLDAFGEPFLFKSNPAIFITRKTGNGNEVEGYFDWIPDASAARAKPYIMVLRVFDGSFAQDQSILVKVSAATSFDVLESNEIQIYPNPSKGNISIFPGEISDRVSQLSVMNMHGQVVYLESSIQISNSHDLQLDLPSGIYFLNLLSADGEYIGNRKFIVE